MVRDKYNRAGLKRILVGVVALVLLGCTAQTSNTPSTPASLQAADLRVRLDLLFGENALIIAKESLAAIDHSSDQFASYAALLTANATDLTAQMRLAFGNAEADGFAARWTAQNANFVDYAIGVVTHDQDKANAAKARLASDSSPKLADFLTRLLHIPAGSLNERFKYWVEAIEGTINRGFVGDYLFMYGDLHNAYVWEAGLGDVLARPIARAFPDKFPGDVSSSAVTVRAQTNVVLQEHAYFVTMATDATINGRTAERAQEQQSLSDNARWIASTLNSKPVADLWAAEASAAENYAVRYDIASRQALTDKFVADLSSIKRVPANVVGEQAKALVKVIDDQRAKAFKSVAVDDRAAATAMQPLADALAEG
jgi:hypothetical protein